MRQPDSRVFRDARRPDDQRAEAHSLRWETGPRRAGPQESVSERGLFSGYSSEYTPLGGYAALLGAYVGIFGSLLVAGRAKHRLRRLRVSEIALFGVATHALTRTLTRDWVTAPIRAPFVRYEKSLGAGRVAEQARGKGLRLAVGYLLTCPWCTGPWIAATLVAGWSVRPRMTKLVAGTFAAAAISDSLHHVYRALTKVAR